MRTTGRNHAHRLQAASSWFVEQRAHCLFELPPRDGVDSMADGVPAPIQKIGLRHSGQPVGGVGAVGAVTHRDVVHSVVAKKLPCRTLEILSIHADKCHTAGDKLTTRIAAKLGQLEPTVVEPPPQRQRPGLAPIPKNRKRERALHPLNSPRRPKSDCPHWRQSHGSPRQLSTPSPNATPCCWP